MFLQHCQICVLVAVAILEECCRASADMQWLFFSGERIVAHGPLVMFWSFYFQFIQLNHVLELLLAKPAEDHFRYNLQNM